MENPQSSYMMPRMVPMHKFLLLVFVLSLVCLGFEITWMINTASVDSKQEVVQVKNTLVFDIGMNNGDDTSLLLELGYNVVAVEANPVLVDAAKKRFASEISQGRLSIAHVALPLGKSKADQAGVKFYISKRRDVWSSFYASVGCRGECWQDTECSGTNPKPCCRGPENCDAVEVKTVSCLDIMNLYGTPYIMKLDVEGGEPTCIDAAQSLENKPRIVTLERNPWGYPDLFDDMKLAGYTQYKLVEQGGAVKQLGIVSGPLGALALDCKRGYLWHEMSDHTPEYEKELVQNCTKNAHNKKPWYDWHFRHPGNAAGLRGAFT